MNSTIEQRTHLLEKLWAVQNKKGFIRTSDVQRLSQELNISTIEIDGVISFFHYFHRTPVGKNVVYLSNNITAEMKGFAELKKVLEEECGTTFGGEPDPSGTFSLFETSCIGLGDYEPAALINFKPFTDLTPEKVRHIVAHIKKGGKAEEICDRIEDKIRFHPKNHSIIFRDYKIGESLKKLFKKTPQEVIAEVSESKLAGRGGAYFSTGRKWMYASKTLSNEKYIICNADEGEPGTFKDRMMLNRYPGLVLEGMITAAYAIGAHKGYIYLRAEYQYLRPKIQEMIDKFYEFGLLGEDIMGHGFHFDIEIFVGAGAYICGLASALLESMEGRRGEPRTKMFHLVERGYLNKPTVVNNVETLAYAARLMELGLDEYLQTAAEIPGDTKILSISGHCKKPGIYEIEWGMTIRQLLDLCGAENTKAIQFNGPSGTLVAKEEFDNTYLVPWNFPLDKLPDTGKPKRGLMAMGSTMIFDESVDIFDVVMNFNKFFIGESCGYCTPCRAGNYLMGERLKKIRRGDASLSELKDLEKYTFYVKNASRCGLGETAPRIIIDALKKYPEVFESKIKKKEQVLDIEEAISLHKKYAEQTKNKKQ